LEINKQVRIQIASHSQVIIVRNVGLHGMWVGGVLFVGDWDRSKRRELCRVRGLVWGQIMVTLITLVQTIAVKGRIGTALP